MKFSTGIVLASSSIALAAMRDHPPPHLVRFADDAVFTKIGGDQDNLGSQLQPRQSAPENESPAFPSSSFYAPLTFTPSMPDAGYTPPTYAPSSATVVPGSPAGPAPGPPGGPGGAHGPPSYATYSSEPCSSSTEFWGGKTFSQSSASPSGPTGWGWAPPPANPTGGASSYQPAPSIPTSTWRTTTSPVAPPTSAPSPDQPAAATTTDSGNGFQQGPTPSAKPSSVQNSASGLSSSLVGVFLSLGMVALTAVSL